VLIEIIKYFIAG